MLLGKEKSKILKAVIILWYLGVLNKKEGEKGYYMQNTQMYQNPEVSISVLKITLASFCSG